VVLLRYSQAYKARTERIPELSLITTSRYQMSKMNEAWAGWDAALPDNYRMKPEDLAALMNKLKQEYGRTN
jgi:hypothetical protein